MNKLILSGAVLPVLAIFVPNAFAESDQTHFNVGWTDGENQAASDISTGQFNSFSGANSQCPDGHSHAYCKGWNSGYSDEFSRSLQQNGNTVQTQGASENTNIRGNNNHVTNVINQGQASNSDSNSGSGHGSGQPRCVILCANVNVH